MGSLVLTQFSNLTLPCPETQILWKEPKCGQSHSIHRCLASWKQQVAACRYKELAFIVFLEFVFVFFFHNLQFSPPLQKALSHSSPSHPLFSYPTEWFQGWGTLVKKIDCRSHWTHRNYTVQKEAIRPIESTLTTVPHQPLSPQPHTFNPLIFTVTWLQCECKPTCDK